METLNCPLCLIPVEASAISAHLRYELRHPLYACSRCHVTFCDDAEADKHFHGPFAKHPDTQPQLIKPPSDVVKEARLVELIRLAKGGQEAVQERLCVCGQCRLICREDFRAPHPVTKPRDFQVKASPDSAIQYSATAPIQQRQEGAGVQYSEGRTHEFVEEGSMDSDASFADEIGTFKAAQFDMFERGSAGVEPCSRRPLADESEPKDVSDRDERDCPEQYDKDIPDQQQPSEEEVPKATKEPQKSAPKRKVTRKKSIPKTPVTGKHSGQKPPQAKKSISTAKELHCRSCDRAVRSWDVKEHAARFHLRQPLYECKLCEHTSPSANVGRINGHVKAAHGKAPGRDNVDSSGMERYAATIKTMVQELFGV